jgi:apolipoprotein N-acyltransferase
MAALSGVLLVFSFPRFGHPAVAWIALTPLLAALGRSPLPRAFALGLLTGGIYFTGTLYWISNVMRIYGDLQAGVAVLVNLLLVAYLALFPALFAVIVRRLIMGFGTRALLASPFVWVATELGRTGLLMGGFPWALIGYSQVTVLPVAQLASLFGVYGVSGLVTAVSASLAFFAAERTRRRGALVPLAATLALVMLIAVWGARRIADARWMRSGSTLRVGLIQGNVDQGEKWDAGKAAAIFASYLQFTREAIAQGAELVLWPESSTPFLFEEDTRGAEQIRRIAREAKVPILVGSDQIERARPGAPARYYNAAFMVQSDGSTGGVYRKMHLVPFGEYVPYQKLLFFAGPLVERVGGFAPGEQPVLLAVDGHSVSTAICYEIVYPGLVRQFVQRGSELLTTITNDAWFGRTSAPYQHFAQASMRAIENGRYLARAANTGISGVVDPSGRVLVQSQIFEPAVIVHDVRLLHETTTYTRIGDSFAYGSAVLTLVLLLQSSVWRLSTL